MGLFDRRDCASDLAKLLDRERKAILRGDFNALRRLAPEKERLVMSAARDRPDGDKLLNLKRQAARNHALLEAAAHGIRSVSRSLGEQRAPSLELEIYDRAGHRSTGIPQPGSVERRF